MASEIEICNRALGLLGANLITSFNDGSVEANLCKAFYPMLRDEIIEEGQWTFAIDNIELNRSNVSPPPDSIMPNLRANFLYQYPVPLNVMQILEVNKDRTEWAYESNMIRTNDLTVFAKVLREVIDPNLFTPLFRKSLSFLLASELSVPITRSTTLADRYRANYETFLATALSSDGSQGTSEKYQYSQAVRIR